MQKKTVTIHHKGLMAFKFYCYYANRSEQPKLTNPFITYGFAYGVAYKHLS